MAGGGAKSLVDAADRLAVGAGELQRVLDLDDALVRMAAWHERKLRVVELH